MEERLQKIMANRGICSRRKAEELIKSGKVKVNGVTITELGFKCTIDANIIVEGYTNKSVKEEKVTFVFNKPLGVVSSSSDDRGRKTVIDFFKEEPYRLFPVGRLDYNTAGCILISNDGELTNLICHPSSHLVKTYIVTVEGFITDSALRELHDGVLLEDGLTQKAEIALGKRNDEVSIFKISIHEGRNRQVRRMCEAVGYKVKSLFRESVGMINVADVKRGEYRRLSDGEINMLKKICLANKKNNIIPDYKKKS